MSHCYKKSRAQYVYLFIFSGVYNSKWLIGFYFRFGVWFITTEVLEFCRTLHKKKFKMIFRNKQPLHIALYVIIHQNYAMALAKLINPVEVRTTLKDNEQQSDLWEVCFLLGCLDQTQKHHCLNYQLDWEAEKLQQHKHYITLHNLFGTNFSTTVVIKSR